MKRWTTTTVLGTGLLAGALLVPGEPGRAAPTATTDRVTVSSRGAQGDADSYRAALSADGRYVAFESMATTLVPGDTNRADDVFVRDRRTGTTTRVSVTSTGAQATGHSADPAISADGRYVAFYSGARNLTCGKPARHGGTFVHDRRTGKTTCVSAPTGAHRTGFYGDPSISADGRYVAFYSQEATVVTGDTNGAFDVFVYDRRTGKTTRESLSDHGAQLGGDSGHPTISADGRYVAFMSEAGNATPGDRNGVQDVFVRDRVARTTTRVSVWPDGLEGNGASGRQAISSDGRYVSFATEATNVVPGDTAGHVFAWDRLTGTNRDLGRGLGTASLSGDGRYVAFASQDPALLPEGGWGLVVRDLETGANTVVRTSTTGVDYDDLEPRISADGRRVSITTADPVTPDDTNAAVDVFVRELAPAPGTERLSVSSTGAQADGESLSEPATSADGAVVAFLSAADNLVPGDTPGERRDVYVRDTRAGTTSRVSVSEDGTPLVGSIFDPAISGDGTHVAFTVVASGEPRDWRTGADVVVHDRRTGTASRPVVSSGGGRPDGSSYSAALSADGRYVAFTSLATNLVRRPTNRWEHVYVRDRVAGTTTRVDVASDGTDSNGPSGDPVLSPDGRFVAFVSAGSNLVRADRNHGSDVFVHDRRTGVTELVTIGSTGRQSAPGARYRPAISADGRYVAFVSPAADLVPRDTNGRDDIFVRDRKARTTERVSVSTTGRQADGASYSVTISADGRYVAFVALSGLLVPGDTNGFSDVLVRDRWVRTTTRVSLAYDGAQANGYSGGSISADGRWVAFYSSATNLVPGDTNGVEDVFRRRLGP
jgi:Tol biopolymer transport system component